MDFSISMDFENYKKKLSEIFLKKSVLFQLGFDFYDTNNDERISELDIFKTF